MTSFIKVILLLSTIFSVFLKSQDVYEKYPLGQNFYKDGINGLNKDIRKIIKQYKLKPCENGDETYIASVLVNQESKIQFVKDFDTINIRKNKCAYEFTKSVLPYLERWLPAKVEGKKVNAIAAFTINPYFLFNHKYWYDEKNKAPVYEKSLADFQYEVKEIIEKKIKENISDRRISMSVVISENGKLEDVIINNLQLNEITEKELKRDILSIKGKWKPGLINGIPVRYTLHLNFRQEFSFDVEKQKWEELEKKFRGF